MNASASQRREPERAERRYQQSETHPHARDAGR